MNRIKDRLAKEHGVPVPRQGVLLQIAGTGVQNFMPVGGSLLAVSIGEEEQTALLSLESEFAGFRITGDEAFIMGAVAMSCWYLEPLPVPESFLHNELENGSLLMMLGAPMYLVFERRPEPSEVLAYVEACEV